MAKVRLYSYEPWTNGNCVDTNCDSPRVGKSVQMLLRDGTRADTLRCHDCGIELPEKVWRRAKRENRSFDTLTKMSRKLIAPMNGTEESIHYRVAHGIIPPPKVKGPARRERITEGEVMAKKKAKKSKKVKKAKKTKATRPAKTTYPGRKGPQDDPRLPKVGKIITTTYKGREIKVKRMSEGFRYNGKTYNSLSKIATKIAKCSQNGFRFFGLNGTKAKVGKKTKKTKKAGRVKV